MGVIHSTKISGNFSLKLYGSVRSNRKSFEKIGPPFEVDHFSRLERSNQNGPFHLTSPNHSQSPDIAVRYLSCTKWRKILNTALLWIVNSGSNGVTPTSMYNCDRSVVASQAKCMFWLLTALKTIYFPKEFAMFFSSFNSKTSNMVFEVVWQISGNGLLKISPSKLSSGFNTSSMKPFLRVEWNETFRTCRDSFNTKKFSNLSPEILVEWIVPKVSISEVERLLLTGNI